MAGKNKKIIRYRKPLNLNIGMLIFAAIFVYMVFSVYTYITKEKVQFYEVADGSIVEDKSYSGIILRNETTQYADSAGIINYYVREGKRASVNTCIYSIDESGAMTSFLEKQSEAGGALTDRDLLDVRKLLDTYTLSYTDETFDAVYDTRYTLEAMVMEYVNFNTLENQGEMVDQLGINFKQVTTPLSGVVSYSIDTYETLDSSRITEEMFDRSQYTKAITKAGQRVEAGTPIYKVITDDNWSVVFPLSEEDAVDFGSKGTLKVSFPGHDLKTNGIFSLITGGTDKLTENWSLTSIWFSLCRTGMWILRSRQTPRKDLRFPSVPSPPKTFIWCLWILLQKAAMDWKTDLIRRSIRKAGHRWYLSRLPSIIPTTNTTILNVIRTRRSRPGIIW